MTECLMVGTTYKTPEHNFDEQLRRGLAQQARQPLCAVWAEALSVAELYVAGALAPNATYHPYVPITVHLPRRSVSHALEDQGLLRRDVK